MIWVFQVTPWFQVQGYQRMIVFRKLQHPFKWVDVQALRKRRFFLFIHPSDFEIFQSIIFLCLGQICEGSSFFIAIYRLQISKNNTRKKNSNSIPKLETPKLVLLQFPSSNDSSQGSFQTTFTRRSRQVVQNCLLFVNIYTIENVNAGGQVVKKAKILSTQFVNDPYDLFFLLSFGMK